MYKSRRGLSHTTLSADDPTHNLIKKKPSKVKETNVMKNYEEP